jgi:uncharacterized membrane protein
MSVNGWKSILQRISLSTAAFAAVMIATGIWGLAQRAFVGIWAPGIQPVGVRPTMVVLCSLISMASGAGLLWPRYASIGARMLLTLLFVWLVWCKGFALPRSPTELVAWESLGETAVVTSAAWALAASPPDVGSFLRLAHVGPRLLYGLALIAFGAAHLGYIALTASLVPNWLPWHIAWVYLTGATYIAAGIALVGGRLSRLAAILSAIQMALFGILVWLPRIAAGARDVGTVDEAAISFALAVSGWVVATSLKRPTADGRPPAQDQVS